MLESEASASEVTGGPRAPLAAMPAAGVGVRARSWSPDRSRSRAPRGALPRYLRGAFFLPATVFRRPFRVRALVFVR